MAETAALDWDSLDADRYAQEGAAIEALLAASPLDVAARASVEAEARDLVRRQRSAAPAPMHAPGRR